MSGYILQAITLEKLFQKIPILRIAVSYGTGVLAAAYLKPESSLFFLSAGILFLVLILLNIRYRFSFEGIFGALTSILFFLLGIAFFNQHNQPPALFENGQFSAVVLEKPEEKPNSYKTVLKINSFIKEDSTFQANEKILAYFGKNSHAEDLVPGSVILFKENPRIVTNNGNPYEFDYPKYLNRQKIYRQLYLADGKWKPTNIMVNSPVIMAEKLREKLLTIYRQQNLGENETAILSALTLGYKRGLDPETKRVFSSAGAMHVLAVSGLHVGIIFGMFVLIFGFLKKSKKGSILFVVFSIIMLWSYALLTGLSPSVLRAATMFSLVSIATSLNRRANIYNTLATSAFILLLLKPNNLFEVGFQLSYSAVFGIVFLQPKLEKLWKVKNRIMHYFWVLMTVSIAAQIATFPFTSYYFNQFPTYFLLTNVVIIPAVFVLIILGVLLLLLSGVPYLSTGLAFTVKEVIGNLFALLQWIENLPHSVFKIPFSVSQSISLLLALLFCFAFIEFRRARQLKYAFLLFSVVMLLSASQKFWQYQQKELIVFNNRDNLTLQLIKGRQNYIITQSPIDSSAYTRQMAQNVTTQKNLHQPILLEHSTLFEDKHLLLKNNFICFDDKIIQIGLTKNTPQELTPDILVLNSYFIPEESQIDDQTSVISTRNIHPRDTSIHSLPAMGAFRIQWQ